MDFKGFIVTTIIISLFLMSTITIPTNKCDTLEDKTLSEKVDIPTWFINEKWVYDLNLIFDSENLSFQGEIKNLTLKVEKIKRIQFNNKTIPVYKNRLTGKIEGKLTPSEPVSWPFPIKGNITGYSYVKISDLSQIKTDLTIKGTTQIGGGASVWFIDETKGEKVAFKINLKNEFNPSLENYDFPIQINDSWITYFKTNISASLSIAGGQYQEKISTDFSRKQNLTCTSQNQIKTHLGQFNSYQISSLDTDDNIICYVPDIKNLAKLKLNYTDQNKSLFLTSEIKSFTNISQQINVEETLNPKTQYVNKKIEISGKINNKDSNQSIKNKQITIEIPNIQKNYTTYTNQKGRYSVSIPAPNIKDYTPTSSSNFGSDGIITWFISNDKKYYKVKTFTSKNDTISPSVTIEKPLKNNLYMKNKKICGFFTTLVIGDIDIKISAIDYETAIEKVEIYIDGNLEKVMKKSPYIYEWKQKNTGEHSIKTVVTDKGGNQKQDTLKIKKIF
ncbi:MAG: Ig-like domain-containing protein [Candidatus Thermoplasmatota archaeon]